MSAYQAYRPVSLRADLLWALGSLALAALLLGCQAMPQPQEEAAEARSCSASVPCPGGQECRAGRCQRPQGCWRSCWAVCAWCGPCPQEPIPMRILEEEHGPRDEVGLDPPPAPSEPPAPGWVRSDWGGDPPRRSNVVGWLLGLD